MDNRQAPAAGRTNGTSTTGLWPGPVSTGQLGVIDFTEALVQGVSQVRRKLPASMYLPVREDGQEIKGCPAAKPCTPAKRFQSLPKMQDVDEVIF